MTEGFEPHYKWIYITSGHSTHCTPVLICTHSNMFNDLWDYFLAHFNYQSDIVKINCFRFRKAQLVKA